MLEIYYYDVIGAILIICGLIKIGDGNRDGFLIAGMGCAHHAYLGYLVGAPGLMLLCLTIILIDLRNFFKWGGV